MDSSNSQVINTAFILVGGGMLIYTIAQEEPHKYIQILGFVIIMFGLFRATNHWVETKDDHKDAPDEKERNNEV